MWYLPFSRLNPTLTQEQISWRTNPCGAGSEQFLCSKAFISKSLPLYTLFPLATHHSLFLNNVIKGIWHCKCILCVRYWMKVAKEWMKASKCCLAILCFIWERPVTHRQNSKQVHLRIEVVEINSMKLICTFLCPFMEQSSFEGTSLHTKY